MRVVDSEDKFSAASNVAAPAQPFQELPLTVSWSSDFQYSRASKHNLFLPLGITSHCYNEEAFGTSGQYIDQEYRFIFAPNILAFQPQSTCIRARPLSLESSFSEYHEVLAPSLEYLPYITLSLWAIHILSHRLAILCGTALDTIGQDDFDPISDFLVKFIEADYGWISEWVGKTHSA